MVLVMATFLLDAEQSRWRSLTAGQPSWAHTTTRTTYPGSGSEAAPRFRYRSHLLERSPSFAVLTAAMATPGDLASHWLTRLFSWG